MGTDPVDPAITTCMLFTPANRLDRYEKGVATGVDGIVIDLEDAVPLAEKTPREPRSSTTFERKVEYPRIDRLSARSASTTSTRWRG